MAGPKPDHDYMQDLSIYKTRELSPAARAAFEAILGRRLSDDEQVGVWASHPHDAPTGEDRREAWRDLNTRLDLMAKKAEGPPTEELEQLVDDVCDEVRHGRQ